jgi:Ca2+-binding EF-hand superfamily protein
MVVSMREKIMKKIMSALVGTALAQGPVTLSQMEASVKERFAKVDTNGDGFIDKTEADAARDRMRDARFQAMDGNKDGALSQSEFEQAGSYGGRRGGGMRHRGGMGGQGGSAFAGADTNSDGKISLSEALARPTEHFKRMDTNNDGTVTMEERQAARAKMRAERQGMRGKRR